MAEVYWIHLPEHTNMFSQGYIGVSNRNAKIRYNEHLNLARLGHTSTLYNAMRKYADTVSLSVVCVCVEEYAYYLEEKVRPIKHTGWNIQKGGFAPPSQTGKKRVARRRIKGTPAHRLSVSKRMKEMWAGRTKEERISATSHLAKYAGTPDNIAKILASKKGYKVTEDTRKHMCAAQKLRAARDREDVLRVISIAKQMSNNTPWLVSDARKDVWSEANEIYNIYSNCPHPIKAQVAKEHGIFRAIELSALWRNFVDGWVPAEDVLWQDWKNSYKLPAKITREDSPKRKSKWEHPNANVEVWAKADILFEVFSAKSRCGTRALSGDFNGLTRNSFDSILDSFKSGWNPLIDNKWAEWKASIKWSENA